jgi:hypothetical protein
MESLLQSAIETSYEKQIPKSEKRIFKIAHRVNCNGEVLKNTYIKEQLETILKKINIQDYNIDNIDNEYEFGYELSVNEENFLKMYKSMCSR